MAGAKETPRQKLISLMYLVLLALLALQVSSAVIFKFEQLNQNMEQANADLLDKNQSQLKGIASEVAKLSNSSGPQQLYLKQGNEIRLKTDSLTRFIEKLKTDLIQTCGGYDKEGNMVGATEETKVEEKMLGANKKGKGYELKEKLDKHVSWLNSLNIIKAKPLALSGAEHPIYKNKEEQKHKDFAELNFEHAPLVACLATLTELESNVINLEKLSLGKIAENINMQDYKVKDLVPMVKTGSNYIIAGKKYEAELFLTAQLATEKPSMYLGNNSLSVDERGIGKISFMTGSENFNADGLAKKTWSAQIKVKKPNGKDTIYKVVQEYMVAKPTLNFQSAELPALYMNCANKAKVSVPELGAEFFPEYSVDGGTIISGNTKSEITIVPSLNTKKLTINVKSKGIGIGDKNFKVRKIPLPNVQVLKGNSVISPISGIGTNDLNYLNIKVKADPEFETISPQDARYTIKKWKAYQVSGKNQKKTVEGKGNKLILANDFSNIKSGEKVVVEILELVRINFRNEEEVVTLPNEYKIHIISVN